MSKLIATAFAFGLLVASVHGYAQSAQVTAKCQNGCQKYCSDRIGANIGACQSRCMDTCLKRESEKKK